MKQLKYLEKIHIINFRTKPFYFKLCLNTLIRSFMKKMLFISFLIFLSSCSTKYYEKSADKEVYKIIDEKKEKVKKEKMPVKLNEDTKVETVILTLNDALILASNKNRDYKTQKENVYLSVLDLTYQRYLFNPNMEFKGNIDWNKNSTEEIVSNLNLNLFKELSTGGEISINLGEAILKYLTGDKKMLFNQY